MKKYLIKLYNRLYLKYWKFFEAIPTILAVAFFLGICLLFALWWTPENESYKYGTIVDRKAFHSEDIPSGVAIYVQVDTGRISRIVRPYFPADYLIGKNICIQIVKSKFMPRTWAVLPLSGKCLL